MEEPEVSLEADKVVHFCQELIRCLKIDLGVQASVSDEIVQINLSGPDRALLLSNAASMLNAMEYLVNRAFHTGRQEKIPSIVLDTDNYRRHREAELVLLARMASEKVIARRRPLSLQPMAPRERRIVHLALTEIDGVRTQSQGEGDNRSITIYPDGG